jgi:putative GTP pyrophosphokinase
VSAPSRTQLDQTGERIRDDKATPEDWRVLTEYRLGMRDAVVPLLHQVREFGKMSGFPFTARLKTNYSVEQKLRRTTIRLRQIDDIMGCRLIVPDRAAQDQFASQVARLAPAKVRDRRERPSHGYRAVHVILGDDPFLEVQIRTTFQDAWAELSERAADKHGIDLKYGGGPEDAQQLLGLLSAHIHIVELKAQLPPDDPSLQWGFGEEGLRWSFKVALETLL